MNDYYYFTIFLGVRHRAKCVFAIRMIEILNQAHDTHVPESTNGDNYRPNIDKITLVIILLIFCVFDPGAF